MEVDKTAKLQHFKMNRQRLTCCIVSSIVILTMSTMVVVLLLFYGVFDDQCLTGDGCSDFNNNLGITTATATAAATAVAAEPLNLDELKTEHKLKKMTTSKLVQFSDITNIDNFMNELATSPLMQPRISGTTGNAAAREYIKDSFPILGMEWRVEEDRVVYTTPPQDELVEFVNVIATFAPPGEAESNLKLVLACHYDSKKFNGQEFIGATDSAVPCTMLLDLARNLHNALKQKTYKTYTLQLIFFDGEEAFVHWTSTDSLYGSRHLAQTWEGQAHHSASNNNVLDGIGLFVLLDLLGTSQPRFLNHFKDNIQSNRMYENLQNIEGRLAQTNQFSSYSQSRPYFTSSTSNYRVDDDHKPFLQRGVSIVHVIATPFPSVWHTTGDNLSALDPPTISNLNKIFHIFVAEFLHLKLPE